MSRAKQEKEFVEALARGFAVIATFDEVHSEMPLSEVARRSHLAPATARRCLHTLASLGYVRLVKGRFLLSPHILTVASAYLRASHIDEALMPELRRVVGLFGDASSVSVLDGVNILYIAHLSKQRGTRPVAGLGMTYPAYATAMGRVLLSAFSTTEVGEYLAKAKPEKLTKLTETNTRRLHQIISSARDQGYAIAVDQLAYGVTSLAVPITLRNGRVAAALNSSGYTGLLKPKAMVAERLAELRSTAISIAGIFERNPALLHSLL
jgi:IclR family pca regulon transcriptional regulator